MYVCMYSSQARSQHTIFRDPGKPAGTERFSRGGGMALSQSQLLPSVYQRIRQGVGLCWSLEKLARILEIARDAGRLSASDTVFSFE